MKADTLTVASKMFGYGIINSVAISPDGTKMLIGSNCQTQLVDASSGNLIRTLSGHTKVVHSVAFSPDGSMVLTGSEDCTANLYDVSTGDCLRTFAGHRLGVSSVAFSPDGKTVLTGSNDCTALLWDISDIVTTDVIPQQKSKGQTCYPHVFLKNNKLVLVGNTAFEVTRARLSIYNSLGQTVAVFKQEPPAFSSMQDFLLPGNLAKGVYFYRFGNKDVTLQAGVFRVVK